MKLAKETFPNIMTISACTEEEAHCVGYYALAVKKFPSDECSFMPVDCTDTFCRDTFHGIISKILTMCQRICSPPTQTNNKLTASTLGAIVMDHGSNSTIMSNSLTKTSTVNPIDSQSKAPESSISWWMIHMSLPIWVVIITHLSSFVMAFVLIGIFRYIRKQFSKQQKTPSGTVFI